MVSGAACASLYDCKEGPAPCVGPSKDAGRKGDCIAQNAFESSNDFLIALNECNQQVIIA
jgi:hypothetical protein